MTYGERNEIYESREGGSLQKVNGTCSTRRFGDLDVPLARHCPQQGKLCDSANQFIDRDKNFILNNYIIECGPEFLFALRTGEAQEDRGITRAT